MPKICWVLGFSVIWNRGSPSFVGGEHHQQPAVERLLAQLAAEADRDARGAGRRLDLRRGQPARAAARPAPRAHPARHEQPSHRPETSPGVHGRSTFAGVRSRWSGASGLGRPRPRGRRAGRPGTGASDRPFCPHRRRSARGWRFEGRTPGATPYGADATRPASGRADRGICRLRISGSRPWMSSPRTATGLPSVMRQHAAEQRQGLGGPVGEEAVDLRGDHRRPAGDHLGVAVADAPPESMAPPSRPMSR